MQCTYACNTYTSMLHITTYKFLRDVNFADDPNLGFPRFYFRGSFVITPYASSVL